MGVEQDGMVALAILFSLQAPEPSIAAVSLVDPNTLSIEVRSGRCVVPKRIPNPDFGPNYVPPKDRWAHTDGKVIGVIVGPKGEEIQPMEQVQGRLWSPEVLQEPGSIRVRADGQPVEITATGRKSLPGNMARVEGWTFEAETIHRLYVRANRPLAGANLEVALPGLPATTVQLDTRKLRTEGLRVVQTGFRPDDPHKSALFSIWLGSLGASSYEPTAFEVLDFKSLNVVLRGKATLHHDGKTPDSNHGEFGAVSPVYELDFSELKAPGKYRLHIPGVGCSFDFAISPTVWADIFKIGAKGFYFQRNGIAHEKRFGPYQAPRAFHPADGQTVYESTCSLMDSGNGLNALGTDKDNFGNLVRGATDRVVADAWGGYKDAGDWDTRIQHLEASRQLLEIAELFPDRIAKVRLNIPESGGRLPDVVAEAKWNIDHFKRMQTPAGGIRGGVEFEEHPIFGEPSWLNTMRLFAYAPDPWSSWLYAASAGRLAYVIRSMDPKLAAEYRTSAVEAYDWAVAELARLDRSTFPSAVMDAKCLAAAELLRLTGQTRFDADFRKAAKFLKAGSELDVWQQVDQGEAAALILRSEVPKDAVSFAKEAILRQADRTLERVAQTSWRVGRLNLWSPPGYGADVSPRGAAFLLWAHQATGDEKYLTGLIKAAGFQLGINPSNVVYTSGVGANPTKQPFMIDPRYSGQPFPPGITVYGPISYKAEGDGTWFKVAAPFLYPSGDQWPASETWYDSYWTIMMNEFTIMQSLGPTARTWGYLAFRKEAKP